MNTFHFEFAHGIGNFYIEYVDFRQLWEGHLYIDYYDEDLVIVDEDYVYFNGIDEISVQDEIEHYMNSHFEGFCYCR